MNQRDEENQVLNEYCRTESCVTGTEDFVHPVILSGFVRPGILTIFGLLIAACIRVVFLLLPCLIPIRLTTVSNSFGPAFLGLWLLQVLFVSTIVTYFVLNLLVPHKQRLLFLFYLTATFYCIFSGFFSFVWHLPFFRNLIEHKGVTLVLFIQFIACWIVSVCFASVVAFFTKRIDVCLRINRMFAKINRFAGIVAAGLFAVASMIVLVYLLLIESWYMLKSPIESIGVIRVAERLLDMFYTAVKVFNDTCGTVIIARTEGEATAYAGMKRS